MRDRAWDQLDADVREDEATGDVPLLTDRQVEERIRWMNRLSSSSGSYLRATQSESGASTRAESPPAAMSDPEEDRAWHLFDAARSSAERTAKRARRTNSREDTPTNTSRTGTPRTPVRSPPTQARRLKRPRTRRTTPPPSDPATENPTTPAPQSASRKSPGQLDLNQGSNGNESGGTFLQGLLSNIKRPKSPQTPLDYTSVLTPQARSLLFGPSPPHSPPLPPSNAATPDSFPSLSDLLPVSPEPPPRQRSSSPSFAVKSHIQHLVSQALKPHYRAGRLNRDEFTDINKKICRRLYDIVERGEGVESLVDGEVEKEIGNLRPSRADMVVL